MGDIRSEHATGLSTEIALAERHALLQRVSLFPASLRRQVIKHSLNGVGESRIAADLQLSLSDVRAILETFHEFAEEQAP
jgi:hypothetical protein